MKNYILDTNVLLHDPDSFLSFKDNNVLLPIEVIEEIDRFKRETTERGQNARAISRKLDGLRAVGRLNEGIQLSNGGHLRIICKMDRPLDPVLLNGGSVDNRLIALTHAVQKATPEIPAILVTKDINLRIKADAVGLQAEDYETDRVPLNDLYTGMFELTVPAEKVVSLRAQGELALDGDAKHFANEYCTVNEEGHARKPVLARVDVTGKRLVPIADRREGVWGIKPRNREQHFALRRVAG